MQSRLHLIILPVFFLSWTLTSICFGQTTTRASVDSQGVEGNLPSSFCSISADGRYIAFQSEAGNLVPGDSGLAGDIFVFDRQTGIMKRVSEGLQGVEADGNSYDPSISADGRYVAFSSSAKNLVQGDNNNSVDIFVYDFQTGVTVRASMSSLGAEGNRSSYSASISADGRYIAFSSFSFNLVLGAANGNQDIFIHDRLTQKTDWVGMNAIGGGANGLSAHPSISADGRYVAFHSRAMNLVPGGTSGNYNIFVRDVQLGVTEHVSVDSQGLGGNSMSYHPSISASGRFVTFQSNSTNLVPGDTNLEYDIFVHDRQTAETIRVSVDSQGTEGNGMSHSRPSLSANGRYVTFSSEADNLVSMDTNQRADIFVHDIHSGTTERVSLDSVGVEGNDQSSTSSLSACGRVVVYISSANSLVVGDTNGCDDIFVHDRWDGLGANSIYLDGPSSAPVGVPLGLSWAAARPNSNYWLGYSMNVAGGVVGGHVIDLGSPQVLLATGLNSGSGTGSYFLPPVPPAAAGLTVHFEVVARDSGGVLFDSNSLSIVFF